MPTYNCPTSERDGVCVQSQVHRETLREINSNGGDVFMPDAADIAARKAREAEYDDNTDFDWDLVVTRRQETDADDMSDGDWSAHIVEQSTDNTDEEDYET